MEELAIYPHKSNDHQRCVYSSKIPKLVSMILLAISMLATLSVNTAQCL